MSIAGKVQAEPTLQGVTTTEEESSMFEPRPFGSKLRGTAGAPVDPPAGASQTPQLGHRFDQVAVANAAAGIPQSMLGQRSHQRPIIQAKLTVGQADDKYEQEADRVAQQVAKTIAHPEAHPQEGRAGPAPAGSSVTPIPQHQDGDAVGLTATAPNLTRAGSTQPGPVSELPANWRDPGIASSNGSALVQCLNGDAMAADVGDRPQSLDLLNSDPAGSNVAPPLERTINHQRGRGQSLPARIRQPLERSFGSDFSRVSIHADAQADRLSRAIRARAFTTGQDIFFRQGEYRPGTQQGNETLAHELTHVEQQGEAGSAPPQTLQRTITNDNGDDINDPDEAKTLLMQKGVEEDVAKRLVSQHFTTREPITITALAALGNGQGAQPQATFSPDPAPIPAPFPGRFPMAAPIPAPIPGGAVPAPIPAPIPGGAVPAPIPGAPIPAPIPGGASVLHQLAGAFNQAFPSGIPPHSKKTVNFKREATDLEIEQAVEDAARQGEPRSRIKGTVKHQFRRNVSVSKTLLEKAVSSFYDIEDADLSDDETQPEYGGSPRTLVSLIAYAVAQSPEVIELGKKFLRPQTIKGEKAKSAEGSTPEISSEADLSTRVEQQLQDAEAWLATICDLVAYSIMAAAVSPESMHEVDRGTSQEVQSYRLGDHEAFGRWIEDWTSEDQTQSAIVQFKFNAAPGGRHTLVLERIARPDASPLFRVFQAYEGLYRLVDFLGLDAPPVEKGRGVGIFDKPEKNERAFQLTRVKLGRGKAHDAQYIKQYLLMPLRNGLTTLEEKKSSSEESPAAPKPSIPAREYAALAGKLDQTRQIIEDLSLVAFDLPSEDLQEEDSDPQATAEGRLREAMAFALANKEHYWDPQ